MVTKELLINNVESVKKLFGGLDENTIIIENAFDVKINFINGSLSILGEEENAEKALRVIQKLLKISLKENLDVGKINYCIELAKDGNIDEIDSILEGVVAVTYRGKQVKCKTVGQKDYVEAIKKNTLTLCVGPAGTGKTYLAVALAVLAFKSKEVDKIILTRPAVEAGEKLGFLPGDLQSKVDPYLRPLYDALQEFFGMENYLKYIEKQAIEIAPLAYMRGRTLNNAFIILDEAQNTTNEQMKMFLTRMGEGSKMIVTGDLTQIDLPKEKTSGLKIATRILRNIDKIAIVELTAKDVVRHPLVMKIIKAYDNSEKK